MLFNYQRERDKLISYENPRNYYKNLYKEDFEKFLYLYSIYGTKKFKFDRKPFLEIWKSLRKPQNLKAFIEKIFKYFEIDQNIEENEHELEEITKLTYFRKSILSFEDRILYVEVIIFCHLYLQGRKNSQKTEFAKKMNSMMKNIKKKGEIRRIQFDL